jgi:probable HAF family extracellular repeat protein
MMFRPRVPARPARGVCFTLDRLESRTLLSAYAVIDLGTLGGTRSWAQDLNNSDQVVGYATTAAGLDHAFVFSDANRNLIADPGEMIDLGALPGDAASYAYGINDAGGIVGTSRSTPLGTDGEERAVRFTAGGAPTDLGLGAGSNAYGSNALGINGTGQIVGGALSGFQYVPFERSATGSVTKFTLPAPYNLYGEARAINDAGVVVGYSGSPAGDSGFVRGADGTLTAVSHDNPALPYSYAWDLNNAGQVVGEGFTSAGDYRGFLWADGNAIDLGTLPQMGSSEAYGVNSAGAVVGRAEQPDGTPGSTRAFLYRDGRMQDLNALIPADSGWLVTEAHAINDRGAIAAEALSPGGAAHGVLLVPTGVTGRHVFYNNSAFDGHDPAATAADDGAIAPDKQARTGSAPATFANVTSYSLGLNGVMIDLGSADAAISASDFEFKVSHGGASDTWVAAPAPRSISVRPGAGASGSDRVSIIWDDGVISNEWLQVTVGASSKTALWRPDVFSFANLVGETGDQPDPTRGLVVDANDLRATRATIPAGDVPISSPYDFNRDRQVDARDLAIVRRNVGAAVGLDGPSAASAIAPAAVIGLPTRSISLRRRDLYAMIV